MSPERRRCQIVELYYDAIVKADMRLISTLLDRGFVTAKTTNRTRQTPLIAAVEAGKAAVVRFLLQKGADVNGYGVIATRILRREKRGCCGQSAAVYEHTYRTPLQYAAQLGNFTIVKLLIDNGADDALIAPDGQLALRLAATNSHREIVDYLPRRRGGGFKRWMAKHTKAIHRCKKSARAIGVVGAVVVWVIPRFFVWSLPKHLVVLPVVKRIKWLHTHRAEIPGLIVEQLKGFWVWLRKIPAAILEGVKKVPGDVWKFVKATGSFSADFVKEVWKLITRLPNAAKIALVWLWTGIKKTGMAIGNSFAHLLSFIHTIVAAISSFFQRITLRDVWRGFVACLRMTFVDAPAKLWKWLCSFGEMSLKVFQAMFGCIGWLMWQLIKGLMYAVMYIPVKLGDILVASGGSLRAGGKEIMVWFDPKRI
ncbi:ankyrin [Ophiobolus disseminans]|uniref:Ankyrin n=1 Tax=Ophiobolus disseminans TaxID=1469910 RepID=A0A6A7A8A4_9PLEO|nr:ankyrin [Ophiobolus disseminans]